MKNTEEKNYKGVKAFLIARVSDPRQTDALPAHDKTRFDMGMVFGGYYSMAISDNVKRKIELKLHNGEYPGKACVGYKNIKYEVDGKEFKNIVPDPDRRGYIVRAYDLRLDG